MVGRRSYGSYNDGCASAHALDLIGERWALIVVRELLLGPKRFADLERDIPGVGPAVLSKRLRGLEDAGIVVRRDLAPPSAGQAYDLTPWGRHLEEVNAALSRWAVESPSMPFEADMSPDTLVLAMRAHARGLPRRRTRVRVRLWLTDSRVPGSRPVAYLATVEAGSTRVVRDPTAGSGGEGSGGEGSGGEGSGRAGSDGADEASTGEVDSVDAEVRTTTRDWKACVIAGQSLDDSAVRIAGERSAVEALLAATRLTS